MNRSLWFALLAGSVLLPRSPLCAVGQTRPTVEQKLSISFFLASGSSAAADIARLRETLLKIVGVQKVEAVATPTGATLRIQGNPFNRQIAVQAKTAGYDLRPMPLNTYLASSHSNTADVVKLRAALGKMKNVERVDIVGSGYEVRVRVLGEVKIADLAAAAKTVEFDLRRAGYFIAAGSTEAADVERLRTGLTQASGVTQVVLRNIGGGIMLGIQGVMENDTLVAAAKSTGYVLRTLVDPTNGPFAVTGITRPEDEKRLRKTLGGIPGVGHFLLEQNAEGTLLTLPISIAKPETVMTAAKAAGFELRPLYPFFDTTNPDVERDTPAASGDRILEDLTKVGDVAPDFTLITKDGKSKTTLSDYRGKKPVVLIFGSYT